MRSSVDSYHLANSKCARAKHRPHLLLVKYFSLLVPLLDLSLESMVEVLIKQRYFVKGGAKGVLKFGVGAFKVQNMLMLFRQLFREVYECLLIGLLVREWVLFEEVKSTAVIFLDDRPIGCLAEDWILSVWQPLTIVALSHFKFNMITV